MSLPPSRHSVCLRGDPILDLVSYPEALQLGLLHWFGDFASLRFDVSGQPQVVFRSIGPI